MRRDTMSQYRHHRVIIIKFDVFRLLSWHFMEYEREKSENLMDS